MVIELRSEKYSMDFNESMLLVLLSLCLAAMAAYITGQVMYADQFLYTLIMFFLTANNVQYNVNMMFQPVSFMTRQVFLQPKLEIV